MFSRRLKRGLLVVEGLNATSTTLYLFYVYFYMQQVFGFGNKANLTLAALNGLTYACTAWYGGYFAQRHGYFNSLKVGFGLMAAAYMTGWIGHTIPVHIGAMMTVVVGMSFTWPALEAMVCEGESRAGVQHMLGVYNVVWAATGAVAYFLGGAMLENLGLRSLFYMPLCIVSLQFGLALWLERQARLEPGSGSHQMTPGHAPAEGALAGDRPARAAVFIRMAWLANPFGYIASNTLLAVIPGIAITLGLSTMVAGFVGSTWCFARLGSFWLLWMWPGWHYRFRWLLTSYAGLIVSFALVLTIPHVLVLVLAQLVLGGAIGHLYYSSLFYSMDSSETKGEHGGIHEMAIGFGSFAGPAVGAASLHFLPQVTHGATYAVSLLLLCGLAGMTVIWRQGRPKAGRPVISRQ